jgi:O-antigen/teichoic acid export membrane protein
VAVTLAGALSGIIIARSNGAAVRGEYSAVTAWLGIAGLLGELGLPIALSFYVARDPLRAREYLATARMMMVAVGVVALAAGLALAPILGRGQPQLTTAYRTGFGCLLLTCLSDSYTAALMGRDLYRWNWSRVSQSLVGLAAVAVLWRLQLLTLEAAILVIAGSRLVQLGWSYLSCRRVRLAPGPFAATLLRPLTRYGVAQIAATAPASVNLYLDQLVLSLTGSPANLGRYSIAVSITLLPAPLVSAIGYVLLPRLAARDVPSAAIRKLHRNAVLVSAGLATVILVPLALAATWLVPFVFGAGFAGAVPLVWILTPGGIFLSCGQVVANLLRGHGRQISVAWAEGVAVVATLVLLAALLPVVGVTGAAIASTVPYGISLTLMLRSLWRIPIPGEAADGT